MNKKERNKILRELKEVIDSTLPLYDTLFQKLTDELTPFRTDLLRSMIYLADIKTKIAYLRKSERDNKAFSKLATKDQNSLIELKALGLYKDGENN